MLPPTNLPKATCVRGPSAQQSRNSDEMWRRQISALELSSVTLKLSGGHWQRGISDKPKARQCTCFSGQNNQAGWIKLRAPSCCRATACAKTCPKPQIASSFYKSPLKQGKIDNFWGEFFSKSILVLTISLLAYALTMHMSFLSMFPVHCLKVAKAAEMPIMSIMLVMLIVLWKRGLV